jgi:3-deoxy-manno-octulosonate cytidylyltransferase (CMP-KDO synthetase)
LAKKIDSQVTLENPNSVKVVISNENRALYFSRYPIPFLRNSSFEEVDFYKHIGIYAYRADVLAKLVKLPPSALEKAESLEQLRWMQAGYRIYVQQTEYESIGIDTQGDLELINNSCYAI